MVCFPNSRLTRPRARSMSSPIRSLNPCLSVSEAVGDWQCRTSCWRSMLICPVLGLPVQQVDRGIAPTTQAKKNGLQQNCCNPLILLAVKASISPARCGTELPVSDHCHLADPQVSAQHFPSCCGPPEGHHLPHHAGVQVIRPVLHHRGTLLEVSGMVVGGAHFVPLLMGQLQLDVGVVKPHLVK